MSTVLKRTNAGKAHDHAVSMGNAQPSPIEKIVLYNHQAITDPVDIEDITELSGAVLRITDFAQISVSNTSTRLHKVLDETVEVTCKGIAVQLANGIIKAYAPYLTERGGLEKDRDYLWDIDIIIAEEGGADVTVRYEPFDLREIKDLLLAEVRAELDTCRGFKSPAIGETATCE